ncbi:hypothetical protein HanIR_Chr02g0059691 [Helianthus annuus]|nr:hypothetical protein HanIR_Chr02g0059691 [Helianthus annuus]
MVVGFQIQIRTICIRKSVQCHLGFSLPHRQITLLHQKSIYGVNLLSIVVQQFSWRTVVKQERRFMLKLSRMLAMVSPQEMMTILNMAVVQLKMLQVQVQARIDLNMNHQGRLLILRQMSQYLRENPVRC